MEYGTCCMGERWGGQDVREGAQARGGEEGGSTSKRRGAGEERREVGEERRGEERRGEERRGEERRGEERRGEERRGEERRGEKRGELGHAQDVCKENLKCANSPMTCTSDPERDKEKYIGDKDLQGLDIGMKRRMIGVEAAAVRTAVGCVLYARVGQVECAEMQQDKGNMREDGGRARGCRTEGGGGGEGRGQGGRDEIRRDSGGWEGRQGKRWWRVRGKGRDTQEMLRQQERERVGEGGQGWAREGGRAKEEGKAREGGKARDAQEMPRGQDLLRWQECEREGKRERVGGQEDGKRGKARGQKSMGEEEGQERVREEGKRREGKRGEKVREGERERGRGRGREGEGEGGQDSERGRVRGQQRVKGRGWARGQRKCLHEHWKNCHDYPEAHTWEARNQKDIEEEEAIRALVAAEDDSYLAYDEACKVRQLGTLEEAMELAEDSGVPKTTNDDKQ
ncbi:hypothetical protein EI94DRAFT_1702339 [Lactarius quietus]|nr:hypothetical protein EI94DRAFT_1702339 [Lactarius quietus]